ncbi:MAG: DUF368 domain-containing protein [Deltaproteobacteria bacterium]|nr:MAG: DUF368 domain-containing protein [Deltaproteobacteria bacterium]
MGENRIMTWKEAFCKSPGPRTAKESFILYVKGLCMGSADVIPGVSGGTIALITGIYEQLLESIKSFDSTAVRRILSFDLKGAVAAVHVRFLVFLLGGIATAIISTAKLMNYLLIHHPVPTWSLFFGLIAASVLVVGRKVTSWDKTTLPACMLGVAAAWEIVSLVPVTTPEDMWFVFLSGFIAICAMILPGISGAFILLILGKYAFIIGALKNPFLVQNVIILFVFCAGCLAGILSFSRLLSYMLSRWHDITLAVLTGLMAGSMKKIWPWKEPVEVAVIMGKPHVLYERNIIPKEGMSMEVMAAITLAVIGFFIVIALDRLSSPKKTAVPQ